MLGLGTPGGDDHEPIADPAHRELQGLKIRGQADRTGVIGFQALDGQRQCSLLFRYDEVSQRSPGDPGSRNAKEAREVAVDRSDFLAVEDQRRPGHAPQKSGQPFWIFSHRELPSPLHGGDEPHPRNSAEAPDHLRRSAYGRSRQSAHGLSIRRPHNRQGESTVSARYRSSARSG